MLPALLSSPRKIAAAINSVNITLAPDRPAFVTGLTLLIRCASKPRLRREVIVGSLLPSYDYLCEMVIELKVSKGYDPVVGQLLRYDLCMRKHHAEPP